MRSAETTVHDGPFGADMAGLILAGGQSRRFRTAAEPFADKGLSPWQGRPLVAHVALYMRAQGLTHIRISANRFLDHYSVFGPVLTDAGLRPDAAPGSGGPLAGVLSGLQHIQHHWLFVLPVDVVRWPPNLLPRLWNAAAPQRPAYACTPDGPQPLCMVLHVSSAGALRHYVRDGGRRVQTWLQAQQAAEVFFDEPGCLVNLNTPQDWQRWRAQADRTG